MMSNRLKPLNNEIELFDINKAFNTFKITEKNKN